MTGKIPTGRLAEASGPTDKEFDPVNHYDDRVESYEKELLNEYGYTKLRIAAALAELLPDRGAAIIDLGCGTGLAD